MAKKLILETLPRPEPKANEVLIEVRFAGVNPIDWKLRAGLLKFKDLYASTASVRPRDRRLRDY